MLTYLSVDGVAQFRLFTTPNVGFYEARNVPRTQQAVLLVIQAPLEDGTICTAIYGVGKREVKILEKQGIPHLSDKDLGAEDREVINELFSRRAHAALEAWAKKLRGEDSGSVQ